jgi:hypothetical protein
MGNCSTGEEYDAGLCYTACNAGYEGVGPVCFGICPPNTSDAGAVCIKHSYIRGVGTIPICPPDTYESGALCYPTCSTGFTGNGPVCWGICPPDFPDFAGFCGKPNTSYGRGAGHLTEEGCRTSGEHGAALNGCEYYYGLWYPVCDQGFHNVACCICSPDCPPGFTDNGATCYKPSYPNGVGKIPEACPTGKENDAGLCYDICQDGYTGFAASCFAVCSGQTTDTGTQCQKNSYGRGVGTIPSLFSSTTKTALIITGIVLLVIIAIIVIWRIYSAL